MTRRILLTGASGVVGTGLLRALQRAGHSLLVLARDPSRLAISGVNSAAYDLENITQDVAHVIKEFAPELVIHAGWAGTENKERNDARFVPINMRASLALLQIAIEAGCRQWVSFGSQAEYSDGLQDNIRETSPTWPSGNYGMAKLALYHTQRALCADHGVNFTWLRLFTCYGKEYKPDYIIPYLIRTLRAGDMPQLRTPHAEWDCLHADDAAQLILKLAAEPFANGLYNLASGKAVSVGEMALILAEELQFAQIQALRAQIVANTAPATRRVADIAAITHAFDWSPAIDIRAGLRLCL